MSSSGSNNAIARIGTCGACLQYVEDCECCTECGGVDSHEHGCDQGKTRMRSIVVSRNPTLRGLGATKLPRFVIRVNDADALESTGQVIMFRPTLRSKR